MVIDRAKNEDIDEILVLLNEVLEIHHNIRPDIFMEGKTKYTKEMLMEMIKDDNNPIYVAKKIRYQVMPFVSYKKFLFQQR